MSSVERIGTASVSPSLLLSALRRVGMRLPIVHDVEGYFTPSDQAVSGSRIFGTLETSDARVLVGFDRAKVDLPAGPGPMRVSGKMWLGERTSTVTLMVNRYTLLKAAQLPAGQTGDALAAVEDT
nr:hypothetical protein [Paraburkholderia sp. BL8N3]